MTPISYKDALRAVRKDRIEADSSPYASPRRTKMKAAEREKLGALVLSTLSEIASSREHPTRGIEFVLETIHGPLTVSYAVDEGDIFQKFERPTATIHGSNPHNGKWNFHHGPGDTADRSFAAWRREIARIL